MTSDAAVKTTTGKTWRQWFSALDKAGAKRLTHPKIATLLATEHGVGPWWSQMITVAYERARGMREKHETASGFQMSSTKTIAAPIGDAYRAWTDEARRRAWLGRPKMTVRRQNARKSVLITWSDGTNVELHFIAKGPTKTQVTVSHTKLGGAGAVATMKTFWKARLERLKSAVIGDR